jgi:hypothetical protein
LILIAEEGQWLQQLRKPSTDMIFGLLLAVLGRSELRIAASCQLWEMVKE